MNAHDWVTHKASGDVLGDGYEDILSPLDCPSSLHSGAVVTHGDTFCGHIVHHARAHDRHSEKPVTMCHPSPCGDLVPMPRFQTWGGFAERGFAFALCGHGGAPC